jgi:hypothetical protein
LAQSARQVATVEVALILVLNNLVVEALVALVEAQVA